MSPFRVGLTHDFLNARGDIGWGDIGIESIADAQGITYDFLPDPGGVALPSTISDDYDAIVVLAPSITQDTVCRPSRLSLVARFGVGFDSVDIDACTRAGVCVTITPDGVRRPVAVSALTLILAVSHKLLQKHRLLHDGRWTDKLDYMGVGLTGKVLGIVGFGNIGREVARVCRPLDMRILAYDPYVLADAVPDNVVCASLADVLAQADIVCVAAALTKETWHLIGDAEIQLMKKGSFLVNVARGPLVDSSALVSALRSGHLAGAGLDVFETEPPPVNDPLLQLETVIATPHCLCWTDELALGIGQSVFTAVMDVAHGKMPTHSVNPEVAKNPSFQAKLTAYAAGDAW